MEYPIHTVSICMRKEKLTSSFFPGLFFFFKSWICHVFFLCHNQKLKYMPIFEKVYTDTIVNTKRKKI